MNREISTSYSCFVKVFIQSKPLFFLSSHSNMLLDFAYGYSELDISNVNATCFSFPNAVWSNNIFCNTSIDFLFDMNIRRCVMIDHETAFHQITIEIKFTQVPLRSLIINRSQYHNGSCQGSPKYKIWNYSSTLFIEKNGKE